MDELKFKRDLSPDQQQTLTKLLNGFEKTNDIKRLANTPQDLSYLLRLWDKYNEMEDFSGHLKLFKEGTHLSIDDYPRHKLFFRATQDYREVLFMAANRAGKSTAGGYATAAWATGIYPDWWEGRVFDTEIKAWVCSDRNDSFKSSVLPTLLGDNGVVGTGMLPISKGNAPGIIDVTTKPGSGGVFNQIFVKTDMSKIKPSVIASRTYEQGITAMTGEKCHVIWPDEECPMGIYGELGVRTMTYGGIMIPTFTPISGFTELVTMFRRDADDLSARLDPDDPKEYKYLPPDNNRSIRALVQAGWKHAPHLTAQMIEEEKKKTLPHLLDCRMNGNPTMGSGNVYPIPRSEFEVRSFAIPKHWKKLTGMDVGGKTAACGVAWDLETDTLYVYDEYYAVNASPNDHVTAIKKKFGKDIPVMIDPASQQRAQTDGNRLLQMYRSEGLDCRKAENSLEAGCQIIYDRLQQGRLRVFSHCYRLLSEYETYIRDDNGKIISKNSHMLDALRYSCISTQHAKVPGQNNPTAGYKYTNPYKF